MSGIRNECSNNAHCNQGLVQAERNLYAGNENLETGLGSEDQTFITAQPTLIQQQEPK